VVSAPANPSPFCRLASGKFMRSRQAFFRSGCVWNFLDADRDGTPRFGPQGVEPSLVACSNGWCHRLIPTPRRTHCCFRPPATGRFVGADCDASTQKRAATCANAPAPNTARWRHRWSRRGFAVLVPERLGHGATGGRYLEDQGGCDEADYPLRARDREEIAAALSFCAPSFAGRAARSLSGTRLEPGARWRYRAKVRKALRHYCIRSGRGGHANDFLQSGLLRATYADFIGGEFARPRACRDLAGSGQRSYFSPALSAAAGRRIRGGGGQVEFRVLAHPAARATGWRKPRPA